MVKHGMKPNRSYEEYGLLFYNRKFIKKLLYSKNTGGISRFNNIQLNFYFFVEEGNIDIYKDYLHLSLIKLNLKEKEKILINKVCEY